MRKIVLPTTLILVSIFSHFQIVLAQETDYFFQSPLEMKFYSILRDDGLVLADPYFSLTDVVFGEDPTESPSEEPSDESSDTAETVSEHLIANDAYSFFLENPDQILSFQISFPFDSPDFYKFRLIYPSGKQEVYYNLSEFSFESPEPGEYHFFLGGEGFDFYDLSVANAQWDFPELSSEEMLLISPDQTFSDDQLDQLLEWVDEGNNMIVISNDQVASLFGVYFSKFKISTLGPEDEVKGFSVLEGQEVTYIQNEVPPSHCSDLSLLTVGDYPLAQAFYCLQNDSLYHTFFVGEELWSIDDDPLHAFFIESLAPPYSFVFESPQNSLSDASSISSFFAILFTQWDATNFFMFGVLALLFLWAFFLPTSFKKIFSFYQKQAKDWLRSLTDHERVSLVLFFLFSGVLFLYDFFLFHKWTTWFFVVPLALGTFSFWVLQLGPISLKKHHFIALKTIQVFLIAFPLFLAISFVFPSFIPGQVQTFELIPTERRSGSLAFTNTLDTTVDSSSWGLYGGGIFLGETPFWITLDIPYKTSAQVVIRAKLKSNSSLKIESLDAFSVNNPSFWLPFMKDFSLVKSFDSVAIYRHESAPVIQSNGDDYADWQTFLKGNIPSDTAIGTYFTETTFDPDDFLIEDMDFDFGEIDFSLDLPLHSEDIFYTYLTEDFEMHLDLVDVDSGTFVLENSSGEVVLESELKDSEDFVSNDLTEGVYKFYFTLDDNSHAEPILKNIQLNSPKLLLNTSTIDSSLGSIYFQAPDANLFNYSSPLTSLPFRYLGGELIDSQGHSLDSFSEIQPDSEMLYQFKFPPFSGSITSSESVFFAFSEESWFNPYQFNFSDANASHFYVVVEDFDSSLLTMTEGEWVWFEEQFHVSPKNDQTRFQIDFAPSSDDSWLLLQEISVTLF